MSILQALYDSEISFGISCVWDAGFDWWLGDDYNNFTARGNADTFAEAEVCLAEAATKEYPNGTFAKGRLVT